MIVTDSPSLSQTFSDGSKNYVVVATFDPPASGQYVVSVKTDGRHGDRRAVAHRGREGAAVAGAHRPRARCSPSLASSSSSSGSCDAARSRRSPPALPGAGLSGAGLCLGTRAHAVARRAPHRSAGARLVPGPGAPGRPALLERHRLDREPHLRSWPSRGHAPRGRGGMRCMSTETTSPLQEWTATSLVAAITAGRTTASAAVAESLARIAERDPAHRGLPGRARRGCRARRGRGRPRREVRPAPAARGRAGGRQGQHPRRGRADARRLRRDRGLSAARQPRGRTPAPRRRRHRGRHHPRARALRLRSDRLGLRHHPQPVGPRAHPRRVVGRVGRCARRRHRPPRARQRRHGLDPHPVGLHRCRRDQAGRRSRAVRPRRDRLVRPVGERRDGHHGRRRRPHAVGHRGRPVARDGVRRRRRSGPAHRGLDEGARAGRQARPGARARAVPDRGRAAARRPRRRAVRPDLPAGRRDRRAHPLVRRRRRRRRAASTPSCSSLASAATPRSAGRSSPAGCSRTARATPGSARRPSC